MVCLVLFLVSRNLFFSGVVIVVSLWLLLVGVGVGVDVGVLFLEELLLLYLMFIL